jgi:hypothetical protein
MMTKRFQLQLLFCALLGLPAFAQELPPTDTRSCAVNAELRSRAESAAELLKTKHSQLQQFSGPLAGLPVSVAIGDISTQAKEHCHSYWAERAVGMGHFSLGHFPECGVILTFATPADLRAFALASFSLGSYVPGLGSDGTYQDVPLCAVSAELSP